jgi:hypothetical protein
VICNGYSLRIYAPQQISCCSITSSARARNIGDTSITTAFGGANLRAIDRFVEGVGRPPWSAACITDHGPSQRDEPMWVYVARGGRAGKKNALRLEIYAPHSNGGNKTHDD